MVTAAARFRRPEPNAGHDNRNDVIVSEHTQGVISAYMIKAIRWYQVHISAHNPPCCKYYPSCSNYALQAVLRYGAFRGGVLAALRLLRCRPWSLGGIDDVPRRYSVFYRFSWSKAHEEPRLTPLADSAMSYVDADSCGDVLAPGSSQQDQPEAPYDMMTDVDVTAGFISKPLALKETTR